MPPMQGSRFSIPGLAAGLAAIASLTLLLTRVIPANASTAGFFFLLVVLATATTAGFRAAAVVSAAATLCFNYFFLPPLGRLVIADPENWVALFTFLLTALVASHLSHRAQQQATQARERQQETEQLYALSRSILLADTARPIGTQAAQSIAQTFDSPLVLILDAKTRQFFAGGPEESTDLEKRMEDAVRQGIPEHDAKHNVDIWPITLGGNPIGALAAKGIRVSDAAIQSLLNLVAIALERVRTIDAANRAEVARQNEEFKSTLLDAIAHEFKTPLTSIKASASALATLPEGLSSTGRELASIVEEETDRLTLLVTEAVRMSEIEAGKVTPVRTAVSAAALLKQACHRFEGRGGERIRVSSDSSDCLVHADAGLLTLAIRQVLDNALKYAPPDTAIECYLRCDAGKARLGITDHGPGIPERERERIFEKFYRRAQVRDRIPGTGLGLHIAREIARVHDGDLWVESKENGGSVFCFSLPALEPPRS